MDTTVIAPNNRLSKHYFQRVIQIQSRFNDIRENIQHEGMKGTRVEGEVRKFLLDFLPEKYQYCSGIVIDSQGGECDRSRQQDLLIIDRFFNPKLFIDEEPSVYPVEVVYCGIEIKTSLDGKHLKQAVENIVSLKKLNFIKEKITYTRGETNVIGSTTPPIGIIFAFDSSIRKAETILNHCAKAVENIPVEQRPDLVCILNRGIIRYGRPNFELFGLLHSDKEEVKELTCKQYKKEYDFQGQKYPVIRMQGEYYVVDVARIFIAFLNYLYKKLYWKVIIENVNLLHHYIPQNMNKSISIFHEPFC